MNHSKVILNRNEIDLKLPSCYTQKKDAVTAIGFPIEKTSNGGHRHWTSKLRHLGDRPNHR
jgi:hypothetical protein